MHVIRTGQRQRNCSESKISGIIRRYIIYELIYRRICVIIAAGNRFMTGVDIMKTCRQIAEEWRISERTVTDLCKDGKIPGAEKAGRSWQIPDDAEKPCDRRIKTGAYRKAVKALPIGISDYKRAQSEYYYVDKTLLIRDFLDQKPLVSLFTRPRRFGKTLNMDMLRVYFEISEMDTSVYFQDKAIWRCGEEYRAHQGKYPVIFMTFKDVKFDSWEATVNKIRLLLQTEYARHIVLMTSDKVADYEKAFMSRILDGTSTEVELTSALEILSRMLFEHYAAAPIIIIDEYDTPIQEGYAKDFYDEIIGFMRIFFSGAFKDNKYVSYGFLTGIFRIAQESIFSGLNNLMVNTVMDTQYDHYFGFTNAEVKSMLSYYEMSGKEEELKDWYDGYLFGNTEIYNPWSVINYIAKGGVPQAYWVNTGKNEILEEVLQTAGDKIAERLTELLSGNRVLARIDQNVLYRSLTGEPENIYSLLFVAGYLKAVNKKMLPDGTYLCDVMIPNKEITAVYKSEILSHLLQLGMLTGITVNKITESLYDNDPEKLRIALEEYLNKSVSFYDTGTEGFYHGMMLGLIALMEGDYRIRSNRESGYGRFDICMFPRNAKDPGIIMEFKWEKDLSEEDLLRAAENALKQIEEKQYDMDLKENGAEKIMKLGIAFSGKKVKTAGCLCMQ